MENSNENKEKLSELKEKDEGLDFSSIMKMATSIVSNELKESNITKSNNNLSSDLQLLNSMNPSELIKMYQSFKNSKKDKLKVDELTEKVNSVMEKIEEMDAKITGTQTDNESTALLQSLQASVNAMRQNTITSHKAYELTSKLDSVNERMEEMQSELADIYKQVSKLKKKK